MSAVAVFNLPEAHPDAMAYLPSYGGGVRFRSAAINCNCESFDWYRGPGPRPGEELMRLLFATSSRPKGVEMAMTHTRASQFATWMARMGNHSTAIFKAALNDLGIGMPQGLGPHLDRVDTVCVVCYGTGYTKGFGAPCSKGCKEKL